MFPEAAGDIPTQTGNGKLCSELAMFCQKHGVLCYLLSGKITEDPGPLFHGSFATVPADMPFEKIKGKADQLLFQAAQKFASEVIL